MIRRFGSAVAFCAALTASLLGAAREASACTPPPDGWFMYSVAGAVPANGVVVLNYTCYFSCETPPDPESFTLTSNAGVLVPGSVVLSGTRAADSFVVFRPGEEALSAGGVYTAELEGVASAVEVTVGPDLTWTDTFTPTDDISELDHPAGETVCCTGPLDSCGGTPCFRTEVERRTAVSVTWGDGSTPEDTQYAFRILRDGTDVGVPWSWNGASTGFELAATEDSDCYVLELQRLVDGVIQTFEERCIERPGTFTPGLHPTPDESIAGVLATCDAPPAGYEDAWCEARSALCEGSTDAWCAGHAELCADIGAGGAGGASGSGGTTDTGGTAGATGGSSGSSGAQGGSAGSSATGGSNATGGSSGATPGTGGTSGTGEGGTPGDGEAGETGDGGGERVLTKGCGCSIPGKTSRESLPALAALGLLAFGLRRRVRRPA
jgi:MYXO-CTERM domain-containing protein